MKKKSLQVDSTFTEQPTEAPPFPDITVCNLNPSYQRENTTMNDHFDEVANLSRTTSTKDLEAMVKTNLTEETLYKFMGEYISLSGYYQNTMLMEIKKLVEEDVWKQLVVACDWHGWNWYTHPSHHCMSTGLCFFYIIYSLLLAYCINLLRWESSYTGFYMSE